MDLSLTFWIESNFHNFRTHRKTPPFGITNDYNEKNIDIPITKAQATKNN